MFLMSACNKTELSGTCAPISSATRVEVRGGNSYYVIIRAATFSH